MSDGKTSDNLKIQKTGGPLVIVSVLIILYNLVSAFLLMEWGGEHGFSKDSVIAKLIIYLVIGNILMIILGIGLLQYIYSQNTHLIRTIESLMKIRNGSMKAESQSKSIIGPSGPPKTDQTELVNLISEPEWTDSEGHKWKKSNDVLFWWNGSEWVKHE